jgi:hypothetical protein
MYRSDSKKILNWFIKDTNLDSEIFFEELGRFFEINGRKLINSPKFEKYYIFPAGVVEHQDERNPIKHI